jgi:hypothetical protein
MDDFIPEDSAARIVDVFVDELDLPRNRTAGEKALAFSESILCDNTGRPVRDAKIKQTV